MDNKHVVNSWKLIKSVAFSICAANSQNTFHYHDFDAYDFFVASETMY